MRAHLAYVAAANRWHRGYLRQDFNIYWKPARGRACAETADRGCFHVQVITRRGCPNYVAVKANEYQGRTVVGDLLDENITGLRAKTPAVFELDASRSSTSASDVKIECN